MGAATPPCLSLLMILTIVVPAVLQSGQHNNASGAEKILRHLCPKIRSKHFRRRHGDVQRTAASTAGRTVVARRSKALKQRIAAVERQHKETARSRAQGGAEKGTGAGAKGRAGRTASRRIGRSNSSNLPLQNKLDSNAKKRGGEISARKSRAERRASESRRRSKRPAEGRGKTDGSTRGRETPARASGHDTQNKPANDLLRSQIEKGKASGGGNDG